MIIEEVEEDVKEKSTSPRRLDRLFSAEDNDELKIEEVEVEDDDEIEVEEKVEDDEIEIEEKVEDKEKDVNDMSVKELKALIRSARLKWNDCREKSELRERAREAREKLKNGGDDEVPGRHACLGGAANRNRQGARTRLRVPCKALLLEQERGDADAHCYQRGDGCCSRRQASARAGDQWARPAQ